MRNYGMILHINARKYAPVNHGPYSQRSRFGAAVETHASFDILVKGKDVPERFEGILVFSFIHYSWFHAAMVSRIWREENDVPSNIIFLKPG